MADVVGAPDNLVVGAPLAEEQVEWKPTLSGMGPEKTVAIFNPLSNDFRIMYARDENVAPEVSPGFAFAREKAGLDLSKRGQVGGHRTHTLILEAGSTKNLPGDIAQKAVQDLTTYILGVRTGHKRTADPHSRGEVEKEIIMSIKDTTAFLNPTAAVVAPEPPKPKAKDTPDPAPGTGTAYEPAKG